MPEKDSRLQKIHYWLENELNLDTGTIEPASSDASFRRYFRIFLQQKTHIIMDAPPQLENLRPFLHVAELMDKSGINVPDIFRRNLEHGFLILEDFGRCCYLDKLDAENVTPLYQAAMKVLLKLQQNTNIATSGLPHYDYDLLNKELELFREWFLQQLLNADLSAADHIILDQTWKILIKSALEQPKVCVHRDFHSRNLMYLEENNPGIIDFQDAVIGPITYDLVSLLKDCYISWPEKQVNRWVNEYHQRLFQSGLIDCETKQFKRWFDLMGIQRHLKATGIFSRLQIRDGKPGYLKDIPRTMNYVTEACKQYPELTEFGHFLKKKILPIDHFSK